MSLVTLEQSSFIPRRRWLPLGLWALFLIVSIPYTIKALDNRGAILRWQEALRGLDNGENPYTSFSYPNPPIMGLLLAPLAKLPPVASALSWFFLKAVMTQIALVWIFRLVQDPDRPFPVWARELTVLLSLWPIVGDLTHGNVNLFIMFLVIGGLYAFYCQRPGFAGLILALAIACKVTPALFVPYFVWKRSGRALAGVAVGLVFFLWLIPAAKLGSEKNAEFLTDWWEQMVEPYLGANKVTSEYPNQSLPGLLTRLCTRNPSYSEYPDSVYTPIRYDNILELEPRTVGWLVKAAMALFALLVVAVCRSPTTPATGCRLAAEFAIVVLGMLLFSERTWKHHAVVLVLPFAVLCYRLATSGEDPTLRRILIGCLTLAAIFMGAASISPLDYLNGANKLTGGDRMNGLSKLAQVYGTYVWAYVCLLVGLAVLLLRKRKPAPSAASTLDYQSIS